MIFGGSKAGKKAAKRQAAFNQLAINELRNNFNRTEKRLTPFIDAGLGQLDNVVEGTTAEGLDARLGRVLDSDTFGALQEQRERSVGGALASAGLTRSGEGIESLANVGTDLALQLENLLTGRSTNLFGSGNNTALNLGQLGQQTASQIASLFNDTGRGFAQGALTDSASKTAGIQGLLNAGGSFASAATSAGGVGPLISSFFSDSRLKENIVCTGQIHDLYTYEWDWVETESELIKTCNPYGFLADEVEEKYPQHVFEFSGIKVIDYEMLLKELEGKVNGRPN